MEGMNLLFFFKKKLIHFFFGIRTNDIWGFNSSQLSSSNISALSVIYQINTSAATVVYISNVVIQLFYTPPSTTQQQQIQTTQALTNSPITTEQSAKHSNDSAIIGIVLGVFFGVVCLAGLGIIILVLRKRRQQNTKNPVSPQQSRDQLIQSDYGNDLREELVIGELIGQGNFGEVYKGKVGEATVAVRKYFQFLFTSKKSNSIHPSFFSKVQKIE